MTQLKKGEELDKHVDKLVKEIDAYKNSGIPVSVGKKVKLIKLSDDKFKQVGENHPNNIYEGYIKQGIEVESPKVGQGYVIGFSFSTSVVTEIIDDTTFKTLNSTYKIEYLDE